jgi:hypothetical protein
MKTTVRDLVNFSYCPALFRARYDEVLEDDLTEKFYNFALSCFNHDFTQEGKMSLNVAESLWQELFFKGKRRRVKELMSAYLKSLNAIHKFYKWYLSIPLTCIATNYNPKSYISGVSLVQPALCLYVDGDEKTNLNVVYIVPSSYPGTFRMGLQDPHIKYPLALLSNFYAKWASFKSLTVTSIFHSPNLLGKDCFRVEQFSPDEAYMNDARSLFKTVMTSLNLPLPHNYLGCPTCPISDTCEVKKGYE